jgi:ABC-2 type transport system permease protein
LLPILLVVAFLPLMYSFGNMVSFMYDALAPVEQEGVILGMGLAMVSLIIFLFGIFYVINVFYFAQDIEHLLPLPLTPAQIVSAKFFVTLLYEYVTAFIILAPILVTYGLKSGAGPLFYVYAVLIFLSLPVIPLVIASVVAMLVMRVTNIGKNKDRYRMIGGMAAIVLAVGFNIVFQRSSGGNWTESELQEMMLGGGQSFLKIVTRMFPSAQFAAEALLRPAALAGLANLALYLGLSALFFLAFAALGQRIYFKGVMGLSESAARRRRLSDEQLDKSTVPRSALLAYFLKEWRLLVRTPAYFLNCVLLSFLWPVLVLIPVFVQPDALAMIQGLAALVEREETAGLVLAGACGLFLFTSGSNAVTATAISREGSAMFVNKYIPVPYGMIIAAKVLSGWVLTLVNTLLFIGVAAFVVRFPPSFAFLLLAVGIPASLFSCLAGIVFDLNFPKLHWDNEQKAVKQNLNALYLMIVMLLTAGLVFYAVMRLNLPLPATSAGLIGLFAALDLALYRILKQMGPKWMEQIQI